MCFHTTLLNVIVGVWGLCLSTISTQPINSNSEIIYYCRWRLYYTVLSCLLIHILWYITYELSFWFHRRAYRLLTRDGARMNTIKPFLLRHHYAVRGALRGVACQTEGYRSHTFSIEVNRSTGVNSAALLPLSRPYRMFEVDGARGSKRGGRNVILA